MKRRRQRCVSGVWAHQSCRPRRHALDLVRREGEVEHLVPRVGGDIRRVEPGRRLLAKVGDLVVQQRPRLANVPLLDIRDRPVAIFLAAIHGVATHQVGARVEAVEALG